MNTSPTAEGIFSAPPPPLILHKQSGATIKLLGFGDILKTGRRVKPSEELSMRLVRENTNVPVPKPLRSSFDGQAGEIFMTRIAGVPLEDIWLSLADDAKRSLCNQLWQMIEQWRQIPKPRRLCNVYLCHADGSPSTDVLVQDLEEHSGILFNDQSVRERIAQRYHHYNGRKYTVPELVSILPQSTRSVFTHADLGPRNIMIDESTLNITGILDWECAGWYPEYWEYANIWKGDRSGYDWAGWMDQTNQTWTKKDIKGIDAARRVLV